MKETKGYFAVTLRTTLQHLQPRRLFLGELHFEMLSFSWAVTIFFFGLCIFMSMLPINSNHSHIYAVCTFTSNS